MSAPRHLSREFCAWTYRTRAQWYVCVAGPWREQRASFFFPTDTEWEAELTMVKAPLAPGGTPKLGFPLPSGALQPAFNIYAWNEFGEGGIMAPSNGWRYRRLEAIASVFGVDQAVPTQ